MAEKTGISAAAAIIEERDGAGGRAGAPPAQLALPLVGEDLDGEDAPQRRHERGVGRPPGALNRRTEAMLSYLEARYRSPAVALAEVYSRPVDTLAQELGCPRLEALRIQVSAMIASLPFWHSKLPIAVHIEGKGMVALSIQGMAALAAATSQKEGEITIEAEIVENGDESMG